jgi:hypothetical protein
MLKRYLIQPTMVLIISLTGLLIGPGCSGGGDEPPATVADQTAATENQAAPNDSAAVAALREQFIVKPEPEAATTLMFKRQEIRMWAPKQIERIDYALRDVTRIIMYSELGLGDQLDVELAPNSEALAVGQSIRLRLDADRTTLALRFVVDTLPGGRVRGEGTLGIFAIHADDNLGRDVDVNRTQTGTGRMDMQYKYDQVVGRLSCCDLPPTFMLNGFANIGDTLALLVTFDRNLGQYLTTLVGPKHGRSFGGRSYVRFRTERGEFHKDMLEYPYVYETTDPGWVNLFLGSRWRGRKTSMEPILTARIF